MEKRSIHYARKFMKLKWNHIYDQCWDCWNKACKLLKHGQTHQTIFLIFLFFLSFYLSLNCWVSNSSSLELMPPMALSHVYSSKALKNELSIPPKTLSYEHVTILVGVSVHFPHEELHNGFHFLQCGKYGNFINVIRSPFSRLHILPLIPSFASSLG